MGGRDVFVIGKVNGFSGSIEMLFPSRLGEGVHNCSHHCSIVQ